MSILIIGEDWNHEIQKLYHRCGAYRTECWGSCQCLKELPSNIDGIVLLQDECNHCILSQYKRQAGEKGIPYVCIKNPKRAKSAFIQLSNEWCANTSI